MIEMSDEDTVKSLISIFMCEHDHDIESFLKEKAINFEQLGKSRTFFIIDDECYNELKILAYYTIAIQVLKIPEAFSNRKIKEFDGFSSKTRGGVITELPAILIGQLARNDYYGRVIDGSEIMQYCLNTVLDGQIRLGGRIIMLECKKDVQYLIDLYKDFGFSIIEEEDGDSKYLQMVRILTVDELIEKEC
ncbi:MAG: hypothetical protein PHQ50_06485 [Eubacteriales bacterium]|nr:hypothetical protein [Eubacteriales bacterium]